MVDMFMEAGMTYFDTAFVYDDGDSERAAKIALVERYPRNKFTLATKLCAWDQAPDEKTAKQQFFTSLERTGAGYFDYYLLHAIQSDNYQKYDEYGIWDFVKEQKSKGLIKHWGFSFHASPELLDELLTLHSDAEFVQLQLNYADWENPAVNSRRCYEVARKHGKSITVMEPVKGGVLASLPENVKAVFDKANPNVSTASWAIRFCASLDGIITVLSGMSNVTQMRDNLSFMKNFQPLNEDELKVINQAQEILKNIKSIPCTACHYCTNVCPMKISIPDIFEAMNLHLVWNNDEASTELFNEVVEYGGNPANCLRCGRCERACPQHIKIIENLKECVNFYEI